MRGAGDINRKRHEQEWPRKAPSLLAFVITLASLLSVSLPANADIIHRPHFKIDAMIIVWSGPADRLETPRPRASTASSASTATIIPAISTKLVPLQSTTAYNRSVPLRDTLIGTTDFYVASNSAFSIDAELSEASDLTVADLSTIGFSMSAHLGSAQNPAIGQKAQYAHSDGALAGFAPDLRNLADLQTPKTVFRGNQRTAAQRGTIAEQSVRFETAYHSGQNIAAPALPNITFTVFVP